MMVIRTAATTMDIARKKAQDFGNLRKIDMRILINVPTGPDSLRTLSHILEVTDSSPHC